MTFKELFRKIISPFFWGNIISMMVIALLLVIAVYLSLIFYTHHGNTVIVPNVVGKDFNEAREILKQAGLRVAVRDTGYVTKLAPDLVLDQQIEPGTTVKFNRPIFLTINSDHARILQLPMIIDGSAREARMKLTNMGFKLGKEKRVAGFRDLLLSVEVNGVEVHAGERISVETPLVLVVGNGEVDEHYNGNDSLDWAREYEQQLEEDRRAAERALLEELEAAGQTEAGGPTDNQHTPTNE